MPAQPLPPFDPRAVPAHPIIDVRIALDRDGREFAQVDGLPVTPRPDETARQAAVRVVAELVDEIAGIDAFGRRARAVRARVHGDDAEPQMLIIHRERRLFVPSQGDDPTSAPHLLDGPLQGPPLARRTGSGAGSRAATEGGTDLAARSGGTAVLDRAPWSETFLDDARTDPPRGTTLTLTVPPAIAARTSAATITVPATPSARVRDVARAAAPVDHGDRPAGAAAGRDARTPLPSASSARSNPSARRGGPVVAVFVAAALVLGGLTWSVAMLRTPPQSPVAGPAAGAPVSAPVAFPAVPPAGWSARARWTTGPLAADAGHVVTVGADALAYVTATGVLTMIDAATGVPRWRADLSGGSGRAPAIVGGLGVTRIGGAEVIAVQTPTSLRWWSRADGTAGGSVAVPAGARTSYLGDSPLIGLDATTVAVVAGDTLRNVTVPAGAFALAARAGDDGSIIVSAASEKGWWHLRPGTPAGIASPWEDAGSDQDAPHADATVVGYVGSSFVLLYPPDRSGRPHVVVHTDRARDVRVAFRGPVVPGAAGQRWLASPARTWGVLGRTLIDLKSGSVTDLGAWQSTSATADTVYGTVGGQPAAAGPKTPRGVRAAQEATPEAVTSAGVAVRVRSSGAESVYLLPPST